MKIVDIGICVNNIDPKGIGRIRYRPYGMFVSEIENGTEYTEWDELDPFIALPFLPLHINIIPQIQQSIKIIQYDTNKEFQNVEYISGPYTSPHDTQNQTFAAQHKHTTYGGASVKGIRDLRNPDGTYNKTSRGAFIDNRDTGLRGNYGSDIIFTESGVQLRGGMLISKNTKNRKELLEYPQLAKKTGRFALKKFPTTYTSYIETVESSQTASSKLNYLIEYEINDLSEPTELRLFVYKVIDPFGYKVFNTNIFGDNTLVNYTEDAAQVYLINTGFTLTDPSYIVALDGTINSACSEIRNILYSIDNQNLTVLDYTYPTEEIYPYYFRPTTAFKLMRGTTDTEIANKETFISKTQLRNRTHGSGLIFSRKNVNPPVTTSKQDVTKSKEISGSGEQSFSFLSADRIYIASTNTNTGVNVKTIDFTDLDEYELTQDNYISTIEPNTYSLVRGENLYNFLVALKNVIDRHIHNINEPPVKTGESGFEELNKLMDTLKDDLLNNSIRIN